MRGTRREARERALSLLYEAASKDVKPTDLLAELPVEPDPFAVEALCGVDGEQERIDGLIATHSVGWATDRMPLVDLAILRIATWELLCRLDVPDAVVISEAVELAKEYSTEDSGRFVNGILATIAGEVRPEQRIT